jgi:hypothetical protein
VTRNSRFLVAAALAACAAPLAAGAQGLVLKHELSIYADEKNVGLRAPTGVACSDKEVVVSDTGNGRLVRYALKERVLAPGVPVTLDQVKRPGQAQLMPDGRMYVLDGRTRSIAILDAKGAYSGRVEYGGDAAAKDVIAGAFEVDGAGNLVVLDLASHAVLFVERGTAVTRRVPLPTEKPAVFSDIAIDAAGTVYAVEAVSASVWAAQKADTAFKQAGKSLKEYMSFPGEVRVVKGTLAVVDQNGGGIVMLGLDGTYRGRQLAMGWSDGLVYYPSQFCVTERGELFLADRGNDRVQLFSILK